MEGSGFKEILNALKLHSEHIDQKMDVMKENLEGQMNEGFKQISQRFERVDERFEQIDKRFDQIDERFEQIYKRLEQVDERFEQIDKRFDNLDKKVDGIRVDLTETQETTDFLSSKVVQHERKIRTIN